MSTPIPPAGVDAATLYDRDGHVTELTFDRYLYDPDDAWLRAQVDEHVLGCLPCRASLDAIRGADAEVSLSPPAKGAPLISLAAARRRRGRVWAGVGVVAAAAVALLVVRPWEAPPDDGIRLRGGQIQLQVFVDQGAGNSREVATGDQVLAGERFGFRVGTKSQGHLMIVGVDAQQQPYVCYPQKTKTSAPLAPGGPVTLDQAMAFDDVLGTERIVAVLCERPFAFAEIAPRLAATSAVDHGAVAAAKVLPQLLRGCSQAEIILTKVPEMP